MAAGSIVIDLLMKTGSFMTDTDRASKRLKRFEKEAKEAGQAVGAAFAVAATAVTALIKTSINSMDELSKAAQRSGTTTEEFSKLAYGANLADVSIQDLQGSLGKLAKAQADALKPTSEQAKLFKALDIQIKDASGNLRDSTEVFGDFADRFKDLQGSPEIMAAGLSIFGRSFQNLIPLIKDGSEGLRAAGEEAERFNQVLSTEAGRQAEYFNDNLAKMKSYVTGVGNAVAQDLLPDLIELSDRFLKSAKEGDSLQDTAKGIADVIRALGGAIEFTIPFFKAIDDVIQGSTIAMVGLIEAAKGVINLDWDQIKRGLEVQSQGRNLALLGSDAVGPDGRGVSSSSSRAGSSRRGGAPMGGTGASGATQDEIDAYTRKLQAALAGDGPKGSGSKQKSKAQQDAEDLAKAIAQINAQLDEQIALNGNNSAAAKLNYELQFGELAKLSEAEKQVLRDKQAQVDLIDLEISARRAVTEESKKHADELERARIAFEDVNQSILEEIELIGMSADAQEIWNNLAWAGVDAESARGRQIADNTQRLQDARDAMDDQITEPWK